ncbi:hypothetical protein NEOLEDRAFT_1239282 [Neolentinus lepideus HHB14362 ss-1]|uniref:Alpha/beta-hydrolase n=1 Tax=Neolentinus lepideus HHB14362 ss-1 TaxID=1314782 RepID=A0A165UUZ2_9AGAM|nr:hypothetical protein NEOLEDRAFT_1239282 [Neolentinus lepideus HHB14362 ss-1]
MHSSSRFLCLLGLVSVALAQSTNQAGYNPRIGPSNANCTRQNYQLEITSNNMVFQNVDSNANTFIGSGANVCNNFVMYVYNDHLSTGLSEHPNDTYNVVQASTDLAIATKLLDMLKHGEIGGQQFDKVIGIGHSYGSVQIQALSATVPQMLDAVLLQGFSMNGHLLTSGAYSPATEVFPDRFNQSGLPSTYLTTLAPQTQQLNFWFFPYYSDAAFDHNRKTEQPVTQGVLFTQGGLMQNATSFTGPVHVVTGANDWPFCFNDCYAVPANSTYTSIPEYVQELYPVTSNFSVYIPENTGHAVNAHYSAPDVYQEMLAFVSNVFGA